MYLGGNVKNNKWHWVTWVLVLFIAIVLFYRCGMIGDIQSFLNEYKGYINSDAEHRAELFESIVGGICSGIVTFAALFITIQHENNKDRRLWEREREQERKERLLSVRPFLNIEVKAVSNVRNGRCDVDKDYVIIGSGKRFIYADLLIANNGYGKCERILLDGRVCSVNYLEVKEEEEIRIYFTNLDDQKTFIEFEMFLSYENVWGNFYSQEYKVYLDVEHKEMKIDIREPLLKENER